jgi:hypothetical protein
VTVLVSLVRSFSGLSAKAFTRQQLDRLGIGQELVDISWERLWGRRCRALGGLADNLSG